MNDPKALSDFTAVGFVLCGIILSIVLPLAVAALHRITGSQKERLEAIGQKPPTIFERLASAWARYGGTKYLIALVAATLVAVVIVYLFGMKFYTNRDAILAGFAWESLLNKTLHPPKQTTGTDR